MSTSDTPELDALVSGLRTGGLEVQGDGDALVVGPRGDGGPAATLVIDEDLLRTYVEELARSYAGRPDPHDDARGFVTVDVDTYLTTDHGGGVNAVRRLALVRDARGLRFVEERGEIPPVEPLPDGSYRWSADPGTSGR